MGTSGPGGSLWEMGDVEGQQEGNLTLERYSAIL